jgi:hypothetical protein
MGLETSNIQHNQRNWGIQGNFGCERSGFGGTKHRELAKGSGVVCQKRLVFAKGSGGKGIGKRYAGGSDGNFEGDRHSAVALGKPRGFLEGDRKQEGLGCAGHWERGWNRRHGMARFRREQKNDYCATKLFDLAPSRGRKQRQSLGHFQFHGGRTGLHFAASDSFRTTLWFAVKDTRRDAAAQRERRRA